MIERTPLFTGTPMWRVWNAVDKDGEGPYWYVDAKDKEDAIKQMARMSGRKMAEFNARQGTKPKGKK